MENKESRTDPRLAAASVSDAALDAAIAGGGMDAESDTLLQREQQAMAARLQHTGHAAGSGGQPGTLVGLALSGGGIRSATFCLGVLQALAAKGWLHPVDYLSTVSGGGYIGSALSWWLGGNTGAPAERFDLSAQNFPYGVGDRAPLLRHLRLHGNWLVPGHGIDLFAGLAVVLCGLLLNFAIWIPITAGVLFVMYGRMGWLESLHLTALTDWSWLFDLLEVPILSVGSNANVYELLFLLAVGVALLYGALGCVAYSLATGFGRRFMERLPFLPGPYRLRRIREIGAGFALKFIAIALVVSTMPVVIFKLHAAAVVVGPGAAVVGLLSTALVHFRTAGSAKGTVPTGIIVTVAAGLLLTAFLLAAQAIAYWARCTSLQDTSDFCELWSPASDPALLGWFWGAIGLALLLAIWVNLNYVTLHRFYRDRLMETFMPAYQTAQAGKTGPSRVADTTRLSTLWSPARGNAPYHLVNTNLVLVNSEDPKFKVRGGDSFLLSALHCGSNATGWTDTRHFMGNGMTLATAMAISGAAATPNTGVGGKGLMRNRFVSLLMALVNIQLGYWVPQPRARYFKRPTHLVPGWYHLAGWVSRIGFREDSAFLQLSDGGHFENLGLYELIRRRMRLILVCDAGADPTFAFQDVANALERVQADFGTRIVFRDSAPSAPQSATPLEGLISGEQRAFPRDEAVARRGHLLADIHYPGGGTGLLVLMKTTLVPGLPPEVLSYKATHPDFPDESTSDQFFDEAQFEAYRQLGIQIGTAMTTDPDTQQAIGQIYPTWPGTPGRTTGGTAGGG